MENTRLERKSFLQNDRLLVCSLFIFYGFCILGLSGTAFWWLNQRSQALSASATSTAYAIGTQQTQGTATAIVRATELAQYELVDRFDSNNNKWQTGPLLEFNWDGNLHITSGAFVWDIENVYQEYAIISNDFVPANDYNSKNYEIYVDTQFSNTPSGIACSGLIIRKAPLDLSSGGYIFMICDPGYFGIYYYNARVGWDDMKSQYHSAIQPEDWNRLEILAQDSHFVFRINSQVVEEINDRRLPIGGVALMVKVEDDGSQILFDNFGYQSR